MTDMCSDGSLSATNSTRVVHLCTSSGISGGGAARASYRIHRSLRERGFQSTVLTLSSTSDEPDVHLIGRTTTTERLRGKVGEQFEALVLKYVRPSSGNYWTSGLVGPLLVHEHPDVTSADAIMLYWLGAGFLSTAHIGKILRLGKPVIWRLSDMWAFTGGCHYTEACERYRERCGCCPQLQSSQRMDLSWLGWQRKHLAWRTSALTVVCPSTWMADCVSRSSLLSSVDVRVIHTGVDASVYRPLDRLLARNLLGLPPDAPVVLMGADGLSYSGGRKGAVHALEAIRRVREKIPDLHLAVFGTSRIPQDIPGTAFGTVQNDRLMALIYASADAFVSTSLEDNLPNTLLEALACGIPIVAFAIGGVLDAVRDGYTGLLAAPRDSLALASQIERCLLDKEQHRAMAENARNDALSRFNLSRQGAQYAALLEELCSRRRV